MLKQIVDNEEKIIAKNIRYAFKESSKTITDFSEAYGINRCTISRHLNGKITITLKNLRKYSSFLNKDIQDFFGTRAIKIVGRITNEDFKGLYKVNVFDEDDDPKYVELNKSVKVNLVAIENVCSGSLLFFLEDNKLKRNFPPELEDKLCFMKIKIKGQKKSFYIIGRAQSSYIEQECQIYRINDDYSRFSLPLWGQIIYGCKIEEQIFI